MNPSKAIVLLALVGQMLPGTTVSDIPGTIVSHIPSPPSMNGIVTGEEIFIADPAIVKLDDDSLVMSHSLFGNATAEETNPETRIFRSIDNGQTWQQISTLIPLRRASLLAHDGTLYIIGSAYFNGTEHTVIRKSSDKGCTWTATPSSSKDPGYIASGGTSTPVIPLFYDNRLYLCRGAYGLLYTQASPGDLCQANWSVRSISNGMDRMTWPAPIDATFHSWSEAQIVASPQHGITILPKIWHYLPTEPEALPHSSHIPITALIKSSGSNVIFSPASDFVPLPGAQKKFAAIYDPRSQRYYALTNTVLEKFKNTPDPKTQRINHAQIRNTLTLYSTTDLQHWDLEKILIHSNDVSHNAWQYPSFVIDGDDLLIASRTAFKTAQDQHDPPRGHDSNLLTFHRLEGFRHLQPAHLIKVSSGQVLRYETTDYQDAPLGNFIQGSQPSVSPEGLALSSDGNRIHIRFTDTSVRTYDLQGNLLENENSTTDLISLNFENTLSLLVPKTYQRSWSFSASGNWSDPRNWYYYSRPDTVLEHAYFGSAITAPSVITLNQTLTLNSLHFYSEHSYTLVAEELRSTGGDLLDSGEILLAATPQEIKPGITVSRGNHTIQIPLSIQDEAILKIAANSSLSFSENLKIEAPLQIIIEASPLVPLSLSNIDFSPEGKLSIHINGLSKSMGSELPILKITGENSLDISNIDISSDSPFPLKVSFSNNILSISTKPDLTTFSNEQLLYYSLAKESLPNTFGGLDHLPKITMREDAFLEITFTPYRSGLLYEVQQSKDMQNWFSISKHKGGNEKAITVNSSLSLKHSPRLFLRLKIRTSHEGE